MNTLKLIVQAGIGDISWIYSKVVNLNIPIEWYVSSNGIQRAHTYLKLLKLTKSVDYINKNFHEIRDASVKANITKQEFLEKATKEKIYFSVNLWLENGYRIENFIPELETNLHYEITTGKAARDMADFIKNKAGKYLTIYCSSYNCIYNWNGWIEKDWKKFLKDIEYKNIFDTIIIVGASYDTEFAASLKKQLNDENVVDLTGKTDLDLTIEILKNTEYLVAFASGIPILANVLKVPCLMLYPNHLKNLIYAWPDKESIKTGEYKGLLFSEKNQAAEWTINYVMKK